jgi:hypothetical protein
MPAVTIVESGGVGVTPVASNGVLMTPVYVGGVAVTIAANATPVVFLSETGESLLETATAYLGEIEPLHYWDFTGNRAVFSGLDVGGVTSTPGYTLTRASVGTAETVAGEIVQFASGQLRRTDKGVLIEGARTNLFLNSDVGVTQSITVAAVAHVLSMRGTGTITLTGTSTAGPLVGTGANNTVTLAFTPTAGTLTLTIAGSCTNVQLEAGAFRSSWIPTAGASVARAADILTVSSPGVVFPMTLWAEIERAVDTGGIEVFIRVDDATANEVAAVTINASDLTNVSMTAGGVVQGAPTSAGATVVNTTYKMAGSFATNRVQSCRSGILGTEDTLATAAATPTVLRIGSNVTGAGQPFGYIKRAAIFNTALSDANLQLVAP